MSRLFAGLVGFWLSVGAAVQDGTVVSGVCKRIDGSAAAGARVEFRLESGDFHVAFADDQGRYSIKLTPGNYRVRFSYEVGENQTPSYELMCKVGDTATELSFPPSGAVCEISASGLKRPDQVRFEIRPMPPNGGNGPLGIGVDKNFWVASKSNFHIPGLVPGKYLAIQDAGETFSELPYRFHVFEVKQGANHLTWTAARQERRIEGTVTDSNGKPVSGAEVLTYTAGDVVRGTMTQFVLPQAQTDVDGKCVLQGLVSGLRIVACRVPFTETPVEVARGQGAGPAGGAPLYVAVGLSDGDGHFQIALPAAKRLGSLQGVVTDRDGKAVSGVEVAVLGPDGGLTLETQYGRFDPKTPSKLPTPIVRISGTKGEFYIPALLPGKYRILVTDRGGAHAGKAFDLTLGEGENAERYYALGAGQEAGSIQGTIRGFPVQIGAHLVLRVQAVGVGECTGCGFSFVDAEGGFNIRLLPPGKYRLELWELGPGMVRRKTGDAGAVEVTPGGITRTDMDF